MPPMKTGDWRSFFREIRIQAPHYSSSYLYWKIMRNVI